MGYENTTNYPPHYPARRKYIVTIILISPLISTLAMPRMSAEMVPRQDPAREAMEFAAQSFKIMLESQNSQFGYMMNCHNNLISKLIDKIPSSDSSE